MKVPAVTIIVPFYNAACYLRECILSILNQSYADFELILIDDGSTDNSGRISDSYALSDQRISVFHKQNGGVSSARNFGLTKAIGKWICFIDADDTIETDYLTSLLDDSNAYDLIVTGYKKTNCIEHNTSIVQFSAGVFDATKVLSLENINLLDKLFVFGTPWCKLFKNSIIQKHNIQFDQNLSIHEDHYFYFQYLFFVKTISVKSNSSYIYYNRCGLSLSRGSRNVYIEKKQAYECLKSVYGELLSRYGIDRNKMISTNSFIEHLYVTAILMAYRNRVNKSDTKRLIESLNKEDILLYYFPRTIQGKILKFIITRFPSTLSNIVLTLFT